MKFNPFKMNDAQFNAYLLASFLTAFALLSSGLNGFYQCMAKLTFSFGVWYVLIILINIFEKQWK